MNNALGGLDPRLMQLVMSDPEIMRIISDPANMQALQSVMADPSSASQHTNNRDLQYLVSRMQSLGVGGPSPGSASIQTPAAFGASSASSLSGEVISITSTTHFEASLTNAGDKLVVVDFTAAWCGPCRHIAPIVSDMAKTYRNDAMFLKVDVDKVRDLAASKGVRAMPTFHFYRNNVMLEEFSGADAAKLGRIVDRYVAAAETPRDTSIVKASPYKSFPLQVKEMVTFDNANFDVILEKIIEFSDTMAEDSPQRLSESDIASMKEVARLSSDRTTQHTNVMQQNHFDVMKKLLSWPIDLLPPVLNLLRVAVFHPSFGKKVVEEENEDEEGFLRRILSLTASSEVDINSLTLMRTLCNMFARMTVARLLVKKVDSVLESINRFSSADTKPSLRLAFVSVLINFSIALLHHCPASADVDTSTAKIQCISVLHEVMQACGTSTKLAYRCIVTTGSLVYDDSMTRSLALTLGISETVSTLAAELSNDEAIKEASSELLNCLTSED